MQFFDLSRQFNLNQILTPPVDSERVEGQAIIQSNENIQIELEWLIQDSGYELQLLFKGIETEIHPDSFILVKGAKLIAENDLPLSAQALSLWIDGTLLTLLPNIRSEIKSRLNLWDYVEYDG